MESQYFLKICLHDSWLLLILTWISLSHQNVIGCPRSSADTQRSREKSTSTPVHIIWTPKNKNLAIYKCTCHICIYSKTTTPYTLRTQAACVLTLGKVQKFPFLPVCLSRCVIAVCTEERQGSDFYPPAGTTNRQVKEYLWPQGSS